MVDEVSLTAYMIFYACVVLFSGYVYYWLTPSSDGLAHDGIPLQHATLWDGIYFSIVTVGTLGYGDMAPLGWSRLLACLELLFGVGFVGIIIAKITSRRLAHHVGRLFAADAQRRLEDFSQHFVISATRIQELMKQISTAVQATPGASGVPVPASSALKAEAEAILADLESNSKTMADYLAFEVDQGDYFRILPPEPVCRLARAMDRAVFYLGQLVLSMGLDLRSQILEGGGIANERLVIASI